MGLVEDAYRKLGQYVDPSGSRIQGSTSLAPQCTCPHHPGCPVASATSHAQAPYAHGGNIQPAHAAPLYPAQNPSASTSAHLPSMPPGAVAGPGGYYLPWDEYKRLLKDKKRMKQLKGTDYAPGAPLGPQGYFMTHKQEKKRREDQEEDEIWDAVFGNL